MYLFTESSIFIEAAGTVLQLVPNSVRLLATRRHPPTWVSRRFRVVDFGPCVQHYSLMHRQETRPYHLWQFPSRVVLAFWQTTYAAKPDFMIKHPGKYRRVVFVF